MDFGLSFESPTTEFRIFEVDEKNLNTRRGHDEDTVVLLVAKTFPNIRPIALTLPVPKDRLLLSGDAVLRSLEMEFRKKIEEELSNSPTIYN